ncbi:unnamed protein product, partial [Rodentolepis nana]|uniref:GPS domain-containing protein n=1 Tax=Rodentolepis nana TaxID=102285 RepID=A0A0R3TQH1_RODNA
LILRAISSVISSIGVALSITLNNFWINKISAIQLITQSNPIGLEIVRPSKQLQFSSSRGESFNKTIDFIWLPGGFSNLCDNHITIETTVATATCSITLHTD